MPGAVSLTAPHQLQIVPSWVDLQPRTVDRDESSGRPPYEGEHGMGTRVQRSGKARKQAHTARTWVNDGENGTGRSTGERFEGAEKRWIPP